MSSNPFRKKPLESVDSPRAQSPYKSSLRSESPVGGGATLGKPKAAKKVRVLSPPPLSPDSPEWSSAAACAVQDAAGQGHTPSGAQVPDVTFRDNIEAAPAPVVGLGVDTVHAAPPANPFSKMLQDSESSSELQSQRKSEGAALKAGNAASQALNVDSFKRLLLTGKANDIDPSTPTVLAANDESSRKVISPVNQILQESRATGPNPEQRAAPSVDSSTDESDDDGEASFAAGPDRGTGREKKPPPPPPSSRHGKSLRDEGVDITKLTAPTDVNKPLPPSPIRTSTDGSESPFDRESAGKIPEPGSATGHELDRGPAIAPSSVKRPAPLPPPRRGHGRTESRGQLSAELTPTRHRGDEMSARLDRPGSSGPAPPAPRRPHGSSRQTSGVSQDDASPGPMGDFPSPQLSTDLGFQEPAIHEAGMSYARQDVPTTSSKPVLAPPRPPTRNPSVKRPPSTHSVEGVSQRVSVEKKTRDGPARPPPPPPRQRGSSSNSIDLSRQAALEGLSHPPTARMAASSEQLARSDVENGVDILADLDALQREVDALRGKIG
ncbi:hypothetical protein HIM_08910 [Hirsutella minnesotensis 3608]|uniref:Uncharacterized protein n=1 Tax=Hirsutella minnesotensis 3608 TaxID=1043627 RepID=A0A0F7ZSP3_9HYPO|nr:hypothetical protein HIM_08910 [Hirsutella minnesotensis 3608]